MEFEFLCLYICMVCMLHAGKCAAVNTRAASRGRGAGHQFLPLLPFYSHQTPIWKVTISAYLASSEGWGPPVSVSQDWSERNWCPQPDFPVSIGNAQQVLLPMSPFPWRGTTISNITLQKIRNEG